ncbi:MAG: hypothetical protein R2730_00270 [Chitinophagales bacterium]
MRNWLEIPDYLLTQIVNGYINQNKSQLNSYLKKELGWKNDVSFLDFSEINEKTRQLEVFANQHNICFSEGTMLNRKDTLIDFKEVLVLANHFNDDIILLDFSKIILVDKLTDIEQFKTIHYRYNQPRVLASCFKQHQKFICFKEIAANPIALVKQFSLGSANTFTNDLNRKLFDALTNNHFSTEEINNLINKGADINALNKDGHNILSYLLDDWSNSYFFEPSKIEEEFHRQLLIVQQLIHWKVNVSHIVVEKPCIGFLEYLPNYKLVEPLIKAGANPNSKNLETGISLIDEIAGAIQHKNFDNNDLGYYEAMFQILEKYED